MELDIGHRKIFIGGLSYGTDDDKLRAYFETYGAVQDAVVMKDPVSRRSRGFGFITFHDIASVDKALAHDVHTIDSRRVEAKRAVPRSEVSRESITPKPNPSPQLESRPSTDEFSVTKIFVGGLHYDTRDDDFRSYFEKYGRVLSAEVMFNRETHKSRGFGFIVFETEHSVDLVCDQEEHIIDGKTVEVKRAIPRSKLSNGSASPTLSAQSSRSALANSNQSSPTSSHASHAEYYARVVTPSTNKSSSSRQSPGQSSLPGSGNGDSVSSPLLLSSPMMTAVNAANQRKFSPAPLPSRGTHGASYAAALRYGSTLSPTSANSHQHQAIGRPTRSQSDPIHMLALANKHLAVHGMSPQLQTTTQQQQQQLQQQRQQLQLNGLLNFGSSSHGSGSSLLRDELQESHDQDNNFNILNQQKGIGFLSSGQPHWSSYLRDDGPGVGNSSLSSMTWVPSSVTNSPASTASSHLSSSSLQIPTSMPALPPISPHVACQQGLEQWGGRDASAWSLDHRVPLPQSFVGSRGGDGLDHLQRGFGQDEPYQQAQAADLSKSLLSGRTTGGALAGGMMQQQQQGIGTGWGSSSSSGSDALTHSMNQMSLTSRDGNGGGVMQSLMNALPGDEAMLMAGLPGRQYPNIPEFYPAAQLARQGPYHQQQQQQPQQQQSHNLGHDSGVLNFGLMEPIDHQQLQLQQLQQQQQLEYQYQQHQQQLQHQQHQQLQHQQQQQLQHQQYQQQFQHQQQMELEFRYHQERYEHSMGSELDSRLLQSNIVGGGSGGGDLLDPSFPRYTAAAATAGPKPI